MSETPSRNTYGRVVQDRTLRVEELGGVLGVGVVGPESRLENCPEDSLSKVVGKQTSTQVSKSSINNRTSTSSRFRRGRGQEYFES